MELKYDTTGSYGQDVDAPERAGALDELDGHLKAMDEAIERLQVRLQPVSNQYATRVEMGEPRAEPSSPLRARAERLAVLTVRVNGIAADLDI